MIRVTILALAALAGASGAAIGREPPRPVDLKIADEDKDVAALIKAKGWNLRKAYNLLANCSLITLEIENTGKPFERVTLSADEWKTLARAKTVQLLNLQRANTDDDAMKAVAEMPALEVLLLSSEAVTDAGMKHLAKQPRMWVLLLSAKLVTDDGIAALAAAPALQHLIVFDGKLKGTGFAAFEKSKLDRLDLWGLEEFDDEGAKAVAGLTKLRELRLPNKKITAAGIRAVAEKHLPQRFDFNKKLIDDDLLALLVAKGWLYRPAKEQVSWVQRLPVSAEAVTSISLYGSSVTDPGLKAVAHCTNVESLDLSETQITDATLSAVGKSFPKLEQVSVSRTKVTGTGIKALAGIENVTRLDVGGCELDEGTVQAIGGMKKLQNLNLNGAKFKPEWLKHLAGAQLKELNVSNTAFDDAAAIALAALAPNLNTLRANDTKLGDAGLQALAKLTKLRWLENYTTQVTKKGVLEFKKTLPNCFLPFAGRD
jgi:hypothetical protein